MQHEEADRRGEGNALASLGDELHGLGEKQRGAGLMRGALRVFVEIESPDADWARAKLREWGEAEQ